MSHNSTLQNLTASTHVLLLDRPTIFTRRPCTSLHSTVHRSATAAGWLIRLPVLHDTSRLLSKQTAGLRDCRTLKNEQEEEVGERTVR